MSQRIQNIYKSVDLALCATLALYFPISEIKKIDTKRVEFAFVKNDELDAVLAAYLKGTISVNPLDYFNSIKNLKSKIYMEI